MIRIAIVEDEISYINQLKNYLKQYETECNEQIEAIVFSDGDEIVENYKAQFDVILMDVEMRFMDGMTAAEGIRKMDQEVIIIFITNMAQYAIRGYAVDALDYVLKPISYFAFSQRLDRAIGRMKKRVKHYIAVYTKSGVRKIDLSEIYWIESQGHRLTFHTKKGAFDTSNITMKEVENNLGSKHFFLCNKGYLLNLEHVSGIQDGCAVVNDNKLLISRARKNDFLKALTNYVREVIK